MNTKKNRNLFIVVILFLTGVILFNRPLFADDWQEVTPTGETPDARYGHSMTKVGNDAHVFGGCNEAGIEFNDLWAFNKDNGDWVKKEPENDPPPARKNHCAFAYENKLYIAYGDQAGVAVGSYFYRYDPATNTWETIQPTGDELPEARTEAAMTVAGDKAYLQGGRNPETGTIFRDLWVLYLNTFVMEKLADLGEYEGPHYGHKSVTVGSDLYILGGNGSPWGYHTGNLVYHTDGGTWAWDIVDWRPKPNQAKFNQVMLRMFTVIFYQNLSFYIFGGQSPKENPYGDLPKVNASSIAEEDTILCDMWRLNTTDSTVTRCADLPVALAQAAGAVLDGEFYIFGGMKADGTLSNAVYKYIEGETRVQKTDQKPDACCLYPNYPNPFNPSTTIRYTIPKAGRVNLSIFDLQGRQVQILVNQYQSSGNHSVSFNGSGFTSGEYFYKLETEGHTQINKMLLIK